jgi:hypothetical protein
MASLRFAPLAISTLIAKSRDKRTKSSYGHNIPNCVYFKFIFRLHCQCFGCEHIQLLIRLHVSVEIAIFVPHPGSQNPNFPPKPFLLLFTHHLLLVSSRHAAPILHLSFHPSLLRTHSVPLHSSVSFCNDQPGEYFTVIGTSPRIKVSIRMRG